MTALKRDDDDERRIARDGEVIRVSLQMTDHATPALTFQDINAPAPQPVFDAFGARAGHKPGACYLNAPASVALTADDVARVEATHVTHDVLVSDAWRRPGAVATVAVADKEAAYAEHDAEVQNAWRRRR